MSWSQFFLGTGGKSLANDLASNEFTNKQEKDSSSLIQDRLSITSTNSYQTAKENEGDDPDLFDNGTSKTSTEMNTIKHSNNAFKDEEETESESDGEDPPHPQS